MFVLELLVRCETHTLEDMTFSQAKTLAQDIQSGKIPERDLEWHEYGSDEIRSWHAAVIIHRVRRKATDACAGLLGARSLRIIAYPNLKARTQARMVTPSTCAAEPRS